MEEGSEIIKDGKMIGNGIRKNGLYVMKLGNKSQDKLCLATVVDNSTLWHRRLGHADMHLIQSLSSKELVRNLPKLKYDKHFCDACKIGKQAHASHKAKDIVSTKPLLEILTYRLVGPSAIKSYGGDVKEVRVGRFETNQDADVNEIKLTKDDEADSMDSSKYRENPKTTHLEAVKRIFRYIRGTSHLGLWYPKGNGIKTIVYAESDHTGDYLDRKSTSGVCTFMGCCLTSWFAKKQTALAISMSEAEYAPPVRHVK
ncbi:retrovirus-related pol polyprotein from transposon TNT 1-94 [Tanacetum coccineum]